MRKTTMVAAALVAVLVVLSSASVASAHVTVQPPEAAQGGFTKLTFRVPNEQPDASTVSVRVQFPTDHPFAFVSVKPKAGWTITPVEAPLPEPIEVEGETVTTAVTEITWSGGQIAPGQFDEFEVSVGPLPTDTDELFFPAVQTYDTGEEVLWVEEPTAADEELELPAPKLTLTEATGDDHHSSDEASEEEATEAASGSESASSDDHDDSDSTKTLAIVALVLGALGVILGGVAVARSGKKS